MDTTASQAHPTSTLNQIPRVPTGRFEIATPPKNPRRTARPQKNERRASDGVLRRDSARAAKKQLMARHVNPRDPAAKWINPVVLIVVGGPSGVPTGNPSTGSAGNAAATSMLAPKPPRNQLTARDLGFSARRNPTAAASTIRPLRTKFAVWTQPPD